MFIIYVSPGVFTAPQLDLSELNGPILKMASGAASNAQSFTLKVSVEASYVCVCVCVHIQHRRLCPVVSTLSKNTHLFPYARLRQMLNNLS